MEGNDPHGGHGCICEGDTALVRVSHGMVEVKLLCFRWLSPFLKLPIGSGYFQAKPFPI